MSDKRSGEHWSSRADESLSLLSGYLGFEGLEAAHGVDGGRKAGYGPGVREAVAARRAWADCRADPVAFAI